MSIIGDAVVKREPVLIEFWLTVWLLLLAFIAGLLLGLGLAGALLDRGTAAGDTRDLLKATTGVLDNCNASLRQSIAVLDGCKEVVEEMGRRCRP